MVLFPAPRRAPSRLSQLARDDLVCQERSLGDELAQRLENGGVDLIPSRPRAGKKKKGKGVLLYSTGSAGLRG